MDSYQAMINERKRMEMEAEMNRFEQEISSRPVFTQFGGPMPSGGPPTNVHQFIPHSIQRQLPRNQSTQPPNQIPFDSQQNLNSMNASNNTQTNVVPTTVGNSSGTSTKKSKSSSADKTKKPKKMLRMAGGAVWEDDSLKEWDSDDFRIFCGDLGNDVTDDVLTRAFNRFPSFVKAKVIRDKRSNKSRGYGFISFKDPLDFTRAIKEMNGKYVGSRPIKLRKSQWKERNYEVVRKKIKNKIKMGYI